MIIRKNTLEDLDIVMNIYEYARSQMKKNGNPTQWGDNRPSRDTIVEDIENGNSYVIECDNSICGVFTFIIGEDDTYKHIEGEWLNNDLYGTIHRIASNGKVGGILEECINYCQHKISNIRVDTHENNKIMRHLLEKKGFTKCGIIYVSDGSPRIAYQKSFK